MTTFETGLHLLGLSEDTTMNDAETSPAKHEVAEANAALIQESLASEQPSADQIFRAWRAMLALPFQAHHVHEVPCPTTDFSIKGFIRLGTCDTVETPLQGLYAYLGGEVYVNIIELCKGHIGRVLLGEFYKLQQLEQHDAFQTLVRMVDLEHTDLAYDELDFQW